METHNVKFLWLYRKELLLLFLTVLLIILIDDIDFFLVLLFIEIELNVTLFTNLVFPSE